MATDPLDRTITYRDLIAVLDRIPDPPALMREELVTRMNEADQQRTAFRCLSCGFIMAAQLPHTVDGEPCGAAGWVTLAITVTSS